MNTWEESKRALNWDDHGIDFADLDGFFLGDLLTREDTRYDYGELRLQSLGWFKGGYLVRGVDAARRRRRYSSSYLGQKGGFS